MFSCPYCPEFYATKQPLSSHIVTKHPEKRIHSVISTDNILQSLTNNIIFRLNEKKDLKKLASKITKVPESIKIPIAYLTDLEKQN